MPSIPPEEFFLEQPYIRIYVINCVSTQAAGFVLISFIFTFI